MLTLYDFPASQNGWKARTLLGLLKTPYETVWVPLFGPRDPAFLRLNPIGAIPVLVLEDGRAIPESHAILCYLAEGTDYLPSDAFDRAQTLRWLFFEQDYVQSSIATLRHWRLTGRAVANATLMPPREATARRVLTALETHLADRRFLAADRLTIADIGVFAYAHLAENAGFPLASYPAFRRWIAAVTETAAPLPPVHPYPPEAMAG
ncbi:MAG TPA: glutathione S-transferase family protein [Alphaproteobacteria bacterium]|nr:glutathione S-transferase family protein [Alphaproteobacteria bacterium]